MAKFTRQDIMGDVTPEMIALLSPEEQAEFSKSMGILVGGERLKDYISRVAPHEPVPNHLQPIIDVIEYARLKPIRICLDMAPGHAKTTELMRSIAWWLDPGQSPGDLCAYVTYSDAQARDKSRIAKETLEASGSELGDGGDGLWHTPQGGGLVAKGSRGGLTGKRIPGLLVYDDPYKDAQEARSPAVNGMIIERFKGVAFTRLQGGSIIVLHTRWDDGDLIGWIMKNHKWDQISVPAVCDSVDDALGRKIGEVAWPEKYPYELCTNSDGTAKICGHDGHLKEIQTTLGPHLWYAMFQGKPRPDGTAVFHEPARYRLRDDPKNPELKSEFSWTGKRGAIIIDPAATAKTSADFSVILVLAMEGYGMKARMWIVDCIRIQVEIPDLVNRALIVQSKYRLMIGCEAVAGFKSVPQSLRAINPKLRVIDIDPGSKDKFTRSMPVSAAWNDGRVLVPMDADLAWPETLIAEFVKFTGNGDKHDDQVDCGAHGFTLLYRTAARITSANYEESAV